MRKEDVCRKMRMVVKKNPSEMERMSYKDGRWVPELLTTLLLDWVTFIQAHTSILIDVISLQLNTCTLRFFNCSHCFSPCVWLPYVELQLTIQTTVLQHWSVWFHTSPVGGLLRCQHQCKHVVTWLSPRHCNMCLTGVIHAAQWKQGG